ncbi:MAG: radical SAM family heme chaperone HemW [Actinobacteria bacterium]|nr:radical SAM family heme chaperone HemW [Actinomycetota bacterium]
MRAGPAGPERPAGAGLYLHVPFCRHRCGYCDFNTYAGLDEQIPRYVAALRADLVRVAAGGPRAVAPPGSGAGPAWPVFTSVFVGGGTPTLLPAADLAGLVRLAGQVLPVADDAEVTVEANPETVTVDSLAVLAGAGINRVSIGAQSFAPRVLAFLDRRHDPRAPLRAVEAARAAGIARVSLDLVYGAPAEDDADWRDALDAAVGAGVGHVSAYALTLEPGTPYARRVRAGVQAAPDDDVQAVRMRVADERLAAGGLERYEISNWARPGSRCRHNLTYWTGGDYLGVGAGAHGHWAGRRWWSLRSPSRYADAALAGDRTTAGDEVLDAATRRTERLMMGLRLSDGVPRERVVPVDEDQVRLLLGAGLLDDDGTRLRLPPRARPLAGDVTARLAVCP